MLVMQVGPREAARQMGLLENTVLAWCSRYKWLAHINLKPVLPKSMQPVPVVGVIKAADALKNTLLEMGNSTKLNVLKYARATTEHAASLADRNPSKALEQAANVKQVTQAAALAGGWADGSQGGVKIAIFQGVGASDDTVIDI